MVLHNTIFHPTFLPAGMLQLQHIAECPMLHNRDTLQWLMQPSYCRYVNQRQHHLLEIEVTENKLFMLKHTYRKTIANINFLKT